MTAVWNKFTSQLSNWLAEGPPGKWRRRESDNPEGQRNSLRSSSSLSTLNQKHLVKAAAAIRSKSSENLNRVGGNSHRLLIGKSNVPAAERCQCCLPSEASFSTSGQRPRSASKSSAKANNGCCVPATQQKQQQQQESRFPSSLFLQQHQTNWRGGGGGVESGYSSASPSRKKSTGMVGSASSLFFQNLRGRNKQKQQQQPLPKEEGAANCWAEQQQLQSNASSSGASSAATNGASDQLTSGEAQKKRCWRFSGTSMLPFADEEEMVVAPELGQHEKAETADNEQQPQRTRRPSAPDGQQQQSGGGSLAHALLRQHEPSQKQLQHYLISPPKKAGPKKTKSTFAILFPHNSHLLPSSLSWSSHLATRGSPQKAAKMPPDPAPPPIAAAASAEDGLTVPATEDFGHFLRRPSAASQQQQQQQAPPHSPSQETVRERRQHHKLPPAAHKRKSSSSTGHKLVNALLNAGGRWRSNSRLKNATPIGSIVLQAGDGSRHQQKRSRSVGANQQLRISSTMLPLEAANGCAINNISNVGLGLEDVRTSGSSSLMFGNLTFEDAHPAYWAPLGFRTPQSDVYHSCRGGTLEQEQKSPTSSATSSNRQGNAMDIFRRLEKIGEGSYATVWKSENRIDGSIVALKEIRLQEQEGLPFTAIREISLLRALRHANIVHLHQIIIQQPKALVLVFEYMRTDLAKYLEQYAPHGLDQYRAKVLLFQLLRGLAYCHERKILHRDLKPQNLLLSTEGELKLADFGLARAKSVPSRTFSHDVVTLWYRPPDVLLGSTLYSISLDMWGVGCIFAEMCTGCALFPGANEVGDQLERIFSVRGLPNPELWPDCLRLPKWAQFSFPAYTELGWPQVEPALAQLSDQGQKLLSHFLQLNPRERISAEGAMLHKYFDELPRTLHALLPTESVFSVLNCSLKWTLDRPTAAMAVNSFFDTNV